MENVDRPMKVLIAEPEKVFQALLVEMFRGLGADTVLVSSAAEGIEKMKSEQFELICTSNRLEDATGISFAESIRLDVGDNRIPVLLLIDEEDRDLLNEALQSGITDTFLKNDPESLLERVRFVVDLHSRQTIYGKVLYVEDSRIEAEMIKTQLREVGVNVTHFDTAEEALESLIAHDYDLVLTDIMLAGTMSGVDLFSEILKLPQQKRHIPVLVMSGLEDIARRIELLRRGVSDYVTKPVVFDELKVRLNNLITNKKLFDRVTEQQEMLHKMAMTDQLTGLYNRHSLVDIAPRYLSKAKRHEHNVALVVIDVDHFKQVNDTHGHSMGDQVLRAVADLLKNGCRKEDFVARFGGEEFVMLLPYCDIEHAKAKCELLRKLLEGTKPKGLYITASFGIAAANGEADFDKLFHMADSAVYAAKANGRNCVVVHHDEQVSR